MRAGWRFTIAVTGCAAVGLLFGSIPSISDYVPYSLGVYNVSPPTLTNGQANPLQLDVNSQLKVTGTVTVSGGTGTSLVDEAAFTPASTSFTPSGGLYQTTATSNPLTSGQAGAVQLTTNRAFHVNLRNLTGAETGVAALPLQVSLANTASNTTPVGVGGITATNVALTENPLNLGAQAVSSENSAATTARKVQLVADLVGKLITLPYANPENFVSGVITSAMTGTTSTSLIAAPASGLRNYITNITCYNTHATVSTDILIQDGSGGTTIGLVPAAAVYGGASLTLPAPLRQPTTATAIFVANVTTGASTKCFATGYKGA